MKLYRTVETEGGEVCAIRTDYEACNSEGRFVTVWAGDDGKAYEKRGAELVRLAGFAA